MALIEPVLVGREAELASLLDAVAAGRDAVLVAPPGMGKSTIMRAFVAAAEAMGLTVLKARPTEPEGNLAFSGLGDLLADLDEGRYDDLPGPQRVALRAATLLDDSELELDPRAVGAGLRTLLRRMSSEGRVLIAIDDAQWLDDASVRALAQALRHPDDQLVVVAASRPTGRPVSGWLPVTASTLAIGLTPLNAAAIFQIVRAHLGIALDRGGLRAVERAAAGNPLHAMEFARHRSQGGSATFDELLGDRLKRLPRPTRMGLLAAALAGHPSVDVVARARECPPDSLLDILEPAVQGDLVQVSDVITFRHPLYAQAVVESAADVDRRAGHRRLAMVESGTETKARHLGAAETVPDDRVAQLLDEAAGDARRRGGWDSAIDLLEMSLARTPSDAHSRPERALRLGELLVLHGRPTEAEPWLVHVRETCQGKPRWKASIGLANVLLSQGRYERAAGLVAELTGSTALPVEIRAEALIALAPHRLQAIDFLPAFADVNAELLEAPRSSEIERLLAQTLTWEAFYRSGNERVDVLLRHAAELDCSTSSTLPILFGPRMILGYQEFAAGRFDSARRAYEDLLAEAEHRGDDLALPRLCAHLAWIEMRAGAWPRAHEHLEVGILAAQGQGHGYVHVLDTTRLMLRGLAGELDEAVQQLEALIPKLRVADPARETIAWHAMGALLLASGDSAAAHVALTQAHRLAREYQWLDPGDLHQDSDFMEAALAVNEWDEVVESLRTTEERARRLGRPHVLVECSRIRVALAAARGDLATACAGLPPMLAACDTGPCLPLERGRAYLLAGRIYRRTKQKRLAHQAVTTAVEIFDQLGCAPYAEQARTELARVGLRRGSPDQLTGTERQVATLAAEGVRNTEIAEKLFMSPKTVEGNLSRVYRKLGVRSRTELGRALADTTD